jgi:2-dehydro-3-deoxyphosphogluconate aldolase/(4S)-4-hydroxy-2-oxoglutarate aldolase
MRESVINAVKEHKLIVILRKIEEKKLIPLCEALYRGGVRLVEVTYPQGEDDTATAAAIKNLAEHFAGRMLIGAGTVLTEKQVELTKAAGGRFIISPNVNSAVIKKTVELGLVSMPGALTPTEIEAAHEAGADFVKLFPISSLGPEYVKAVRAPLSAVELLAVGGVDLNNMADYRKAGACGFGIASSITDKKMIAEENYEGIEALARAYVEAAKG